MYTPLWFLVGEFTFGIAAVGFAGASVVSEKSRYAVATAVCLALALTCYSGVLVTV